LISLAEGCDLIAVAAGGHAAPTAVVGAGAVVEPEDAVRAFAAPDEIEVAVGQEFGCDFGDRGENLFGSALFPFAVQSQRSCLGRRESEVTLGFGEEGVEVGYVGALACLSGLNQGADCFAQGSSGVEEGGF